MRGLVAAALLLVTTSGVPTEAGEAAYYRASETEKLGLPFSDAVRVGDLLILSGQIGVKPGTLTLVPGGMEAEATQAMENIGRVLEANGAGFEDVVKCTVMLADMSQWTDFNKVYVRYFPSGRYPARSAFGADGLALGGALEIECMALAPPAP